MYSISFYNNSEYKIFSGDTIKKCVGNIIDWLYENDYKFTGNLHNSFTNNVVTLEDIKNSRSSEYYFKQFRLFHKIKNTDKYIWIGGNIIPALNFIKKVLILFGIDESTIKTEGFETHSRIKKFGEIDSDLESENFTEINVDEDEIEKPIENIKIFSKNPFRQAICVLGGSGAGKSTTIENILEEEGHEFEMIIPSASTTGLLSQFSPS